ncbi:MAG: hypothetical protein IJP01_00955 [Oscillospiraceae bacterium]|nr:hypothetical protein [Oscillospiraceae bacterium]
MHRFADIPLAYRFADVREIANGMSGDRKYCITTTGGEQWLLLICDAALYRKRCRHLSQLFRLHQAGRAVPAPIASGPCEEGRSFYALLEWAEDIEAYIG